MVPENLAASRIYEAAGFAHVCNHDVFYKDIEKMILELYELVP